MGTATRRDFAAAAAAVLTGEGHENKAYELSGDHAWTLAEYAAELSRQSGRTVTYTDLPEAAFVEVLVGSRPARARRRDLRRLRRARHRPRPAGGRQWRSGRLIGRPTTPLADTIAEALRG